MMENNILEAHIQKHRVLSRQKIKWKKIIKSGAFPNVKLIPNEPSCPLHLGEISWL